MKENLKEYCIYIRQGTGTPYFLQSYTNILKAKEALYNIITYEEERGRPYYVDNDFFDNKYNQAEKLKYMCLKVRTVTEWSQYSEEKDISVNKNKIIYIQNLKK